MRNVARRAIRVTKNTSLKQRRQRGSILEGKECGSVLEIWSVDAEG